MNHNGTISGGDKGRDAVLPWKPVSALLALALFLTAMVMQPVLDQAWTAGVAPYLDHQIDFRAAWTAARLRATWMARCESRHPSPPRHAASAHRNGGP